MQDFSRAPTGRRSFLISAGALAASALAPARSMAQAPGLDPALVDRTLERA
jgi:hypothetical protein